MGLIIDISYSVATKVIDEDEEVFVDYNYDLENTNGTHWQWYFEAHQQHLLNQDND